MLGGSEDDPMFNLFNFMMSQMSGAEEDSSEEQLRREERCAWRFILQTSLNSLEKDAEEGNIEKARRRLASNPILKEDPDNNDLNANNMFLIACDLGMIHAVRLLLERPEVNINYRCSWENSSTSPLAMACHFGHFDIVRLLMEQKGIKVKGFHFGGDFKSVPLHHAMGITASFDDSEREHADMDIVKFMLDDPRVDVNEKTLLGYTALHMLAPEAKPETMELMKLVLAHKDTDVNLVTNSEWSALTLAISRGRTENFKLLMQHKDINVNFTGSKEKWLAPLHMAITAGSMNRKKKMLKVLIEHEDIDINVRMSSTEGGGAIGATPLYEAAKVDRADIVRLLLTHPAVDVNAAESYAGTTPLMIASINGYVDVVQLLLNHEGVKLGNKDKITHKTAFGLACFAGQTKVVRVFLKSAHKLDVARVLNDYENMETEAMMLFFEQANINPMVAFPRYKKIMSLLRKYQLYVSKGKKRQPPSSAKVDHPSAAVQHPPTQVNQPDSSEKEKKASGEDKPHNAVQGAQDETEFSKFEMSLDELD